MSADCSPQWSIENEIRTIPGLGSFTAHTVVGGLLGFSRCKWINSHPPAVCHHFGGRALLHRRHANRLEIERPPFINAGIAFRGAWLTSAVVKRVVGTADAYRLGLFRYSFRRGYAFFARLYALSPAAIASCIRS